MPRRPAASFCPGEAKQGRQKCSIIMNIGGLFDEEGAKLCACWPLHVVIVSLCVCVFFFLNQQTRICQFIFNTSVGSVTIH